LTPFSHKTVNDQKEAGNIIKRKSGDRNCYLTIMIS
jgi:hypothetical protein